MAIQSSFFEDERGKPAASGTVEEVVYRNDSSGYTVIMLIDETTRELVTAVGSIPYVYEGEVVALWGSWTQHPEYGKQLSVTGFHKSLPTSSQDILRYLSSKAVKGVGPSTALKIVNRFGAETFEVMARHPEWLSDIPGISPKKASAIGNSFREQAHMRELLTLCAGFVNSAGIARIFELWGTKAVSYIQANPYRLCHEVYGITFERADELAKTLGVQKDATIRLVAALTYVLQTAANNNGHTCLPREELLTLTQEAIGLSRDVIEAALEVALQNGEFAKRTYGGKEMIYTAYYDRAEAEVSEKLLWLQRNAITFSKDNLLRLIAHMEDEWNIRYGAMQREAIGTALSGGVMILTGGPGTGKTTVIRALLNLFERLDMDVALLAPTGRAAKRMSEATVHDARTIHRALEMDRAANGTDRFHKNEEDPLKEMAVIVDESSMIDLPLMHALLKAMRRGSHLVLVGDADQLPSVGCGNVLADLIASGVFPVVKLDEIFRQSEKSRIVTNAHKINMGQMPCLEDKEGDFFFLSRPDDIATVNTVLSLVKDRLPRAYGRDIIDRLQIVTPTRKGRGGTEALNIALQACLNPPAKGKAEWKYGSVVFRVGDRIMQIRNNYDLEWERLGKTSRGVFNGDIGVIQEIRTEEQSFLVLFDDDRLATYEFGMLDEVEHAYAITVHKSQGSEYPVVLMPVCAAGPMLQTRNLLYTALTRAKDMVILVGRESIIRDMVNNNRQVERYTTLKERLIIGG